MKTAPDVSSYLDSSEVAEYLTAAAEIETPDAFVVALCAVAKTHGMARIAQATGLGRESLYKALAPGGNPSFRIVRAILRALNLDVSVTVKAGFAGPARRVAEKRKQDAVEKLKRRRKGKLVVVEPPDR